MATGGRTQRYLASLQNMLSRQTDWEVCSNGDNPQTILSRQNKQVEKEKKASSISRSEIIYHTPPMEHVPEFFFSRAHVSDKSCGDTGGNSHKR